MANFNYNEIHLGGRLTERPQLQTTATGKAVCRFTICVNKKNNGKERADFFTVQSGSAELKKQFEVLLQGNSLEAEIEDQVVFADLNDSISSVWSERDFGGSSGLMEDAEMHFGSQKSAF